MRVRWSEGHEDRLLSALARQIEPVIAPGTHGQRTSVPLDERFVTKSGHVLTAADIARMADEAERGYDPAALMPRLILRNAATRELAQGTGRFSTRVGMPDCCASRERGL